MITREQLQQIRDALRKCDSKPKYTDQAKDEALAILDAALTAAPQPVGMMTVYPKGGAASCLIEMSDTLPPEGLYSLYTAPVAAPQREWVGLEAWERAKIIDEVDKNEYAEWLELGVAKAIEAALKEKNHG